MKKYKIVEEITKLQLIDSTVCDICGHEEKGEPKHFKYVRKRYDDTILEVCSNLCFFEAIKKIFPEIEQSLITIGAYIGSDDFYKIARLFMKQLEVYPDITERD